MRDPRLSSEASALAAVTVPIVLAAGAGRRMGGCKALCDLAGETALARVLSACVGAGMAPPVVVLGAQAAEVQARHDLSGARVLVNPEPARGMTSSLQVGLEALGGSARGFLVFPVDHALVSAARLAQLLTAASAASDALPLLVGFTFRAGGRQRRGHPVWVARELAPALRALAPGQSARDVLNRPDVQARSFYTETDDPAVTSDMNTPEDRARLLALLRLS